MKNECNTITEACSCVQDLLRSSVREHADRPFLAVPDQAAVFSYSEMGRLWRNGAARLGRLGARPGDRILLALGNRPEFIVAFGSMIFAGICPVLVNPETPPDNLRELSRLSGAVGIVGGANIGGISLRAEDFSPGALAGDEPDAAFASSRDDLAYIIFTSGSTGKVKGTRITHGNMLSMLEDMRLAHGLGAEDTHMCVLPVFHASALYRNILLPFSLGAKTVLKREFDAEAFWDDVRVHHVAYVQAVPTILARLVAVAGDPGDAASHLRYIGTASAPCPPDLIAKFEKAFGIPVIQAYGLTETTCGICLNPPSRDGRRLGSAGRPLASARITIVGQAGEPLPPGQEGEVRISGPMVSPGYLDPADPRSAFLKDGQIMTGDIGYLDGDGFLFIVGRKGDMIYRGGFKTSPQEVEAALLGHPSISQAVVFGVPHDYLGEDIIALVNPSSPAAYNEGEVRAFLRGKLARYKLPTRILPRPELFANRNFKLIRSKFKEQYLASKGIALSQSVKDTVRPVKPRTFLLGETVYLRPMTEKDISDDEYWDNIMTREYVWYACTGRFPQSEASIREYWETAAKGPNNVAFVVCDLATDKRIGNMTLVIEWISRTAEMGRFIFKKYQHDHYTVEALGLIMEYAFEQLKLHRMWASGANPSSIPGFLKSGWTYEGRMRSHDLLGGRWRDLFIMGILEEEYFQLKQGIKPKRKTSALYDPEIIDKVCGVVAEAFDVAPETLDKESGPHDIDGWDSLGELLLWSLMEERFDVRISADEMIEVTNIGDIAIMIEGKLGEGLF